MPVDFEESYLRSDKGIYEAVILGLIVYLF